MTRQPPMDPEVRGAPAPESNLALARQRWGEARVIQGDLGLILLHPPPKPSAVPDPPAA